MFELVRHVAEIEWKRFLKGCYEASILHIAEWKEFIDYLLFYSITKACTSRIKIVGNLILPPLISPRSPCGNNVLVILTFEE